MPEGHPHALRHTFGTALAEAGVDLAVLRELMGHDHIDSSAAYIHLAPTHVRAQYDAAAIACASASEPATVLLADYVTHLARTGRGSVPPALS